MSTADANAIGADTTNAQDEQVVDGDGGHGHGSTKASYDDINVPFILVAGIVSAVLTFVSIVCVQAFFYQYDRGELIRKNYDVVNTPQTAIVERQKDLLETSDFRSEKLLSSGDDATAEQVVNRYTIPLDRAIEMTLEQEQSARQ